MIFDSYSFVLNDYRSYWTVVFSDHHYSFSLNGKAFLLRVFFFFFFCMTLLAIRMTPLRKGVFSQRFVENGWGVVSSFKLHYRRHFEEYTAIFSPVTAIVRDNNTEQMFVRTTAPSFINSRIFVCHLRNIVILRPNTTDDNGGCC